MNHVIEVLTGAETEKVRRWNHHTLTTYGIGRELGRPQWSAIGRELMRLGLLAQSTGEYPTLEITEDGVEALRSRQIIVLTKPFVPTQGQVRPPLIRKPPNR